MPITYSMNTVLDFPLFLRKARTETLKYTGLKLKEKGYSKNVRRRILIELDLEIILRMMDKTNEIMGWQPGYINEPI